MIIHQFPLDWTEQEKKIYRAWAAEKILSDEEAYILDQALTKGKPLPVLVPDAEEPEPQKGFDIYDHWNRIKL
jgi:hypothetical protein